jgi:hypothetical protein
MSMNDLQKSFWGAGLRAAYLAGASKLGIGRAAGMRAMMEGGRRGRDYGRASLASAVQEAGERAFSAARNPLRPMAPGASRSATRPGIIVDTDMGGGRGWMRAEAVRGAGNLHSARAAAEDAKGWTRGMYAGRPREYARTQADIARAQFRGRGERTARIAGFSAAAGGAAGVGTYAALSGRDGTKESGWAAWRARRGERNSAEKAVGTGDLAKAIAALPLAKRAALADAVECGDVRALSAAFG